MKDFKVQSIGYSFNFDAIDNIQQKYMKNSEILERINFKNPMIIPNTLNMPNEVPVVIIKHDFMDAQIVIRRENFSVTFPYTEGFEELSNSYILVICDFLEHILEKNNIKYCGYNASFILEEEFVIDKLKNNLLKINHDLVDIDVTYTSIFENRYYINTKIANTRIYKQPINQTIRGFLNEEYQNALLLNIDVNNRYAFNIGTTDNCNLKTETKKIKQILDDSFNEMSSMIIKE